MVIKYNFLFFNYFHVFHFQAIIVLAILVYIHAVFAKTPMNCLEHVQEIWPRDGILRVEIVRNVTANYTILNSYQKEYSDMHVFFHNSLEEELGYHDVTSNLDGEEKPLSDSDADDANIKGPEGGGDLDDPSRLEGTNEREPSFEPKEGYSKANHTSDLSAQGPETEGDGDSVETGSDDRPSEQPVLQMASIGTNEDSDVGAHGEEKEVNSVGDGDGDEKDWMTSLLW